MSSVSELSFMMMELPSPAVRCERCDYTAPVDCPTEYVLKMLELHSVATSDPGWLLPCHVRSPVKIIIQAGIEDGINRLLQSHWKLRQAAG